MSIFALLGSIFGCSVHSDDYKSVEADEFEKVIADTSVVRLDVRKPIEYNEGHISGAINIDVLGSDFEQKACATLPKDKTIALYCRSGHRSKIAAGILAKHGYTVIELNTGYLGWTGAGKPVVNSQQTQNKCFNNQR